MSTLRIASVNGRVRFSVHVQPRASRTQIAGLHGDALKVRVAAPPVDGAANEELVNFFSSLFAVGRRSIRILAGTHSRSKIVEIDGIAESAVHDVVNTSR